MAGLTDKLADPLTDKSLALAWVASFLTGGEVAESELDKFIFGLSSQGERLEVMRKGSILSEDDAMKKKNNCLVLLTNYLCYNGLNSLEDLDLTPLYLVSGLNKGSTYGGYLPLSMFEALIYVNKYLTMEHYYPGLPSVVNMDRFSL